MASLDDRIKEIDDKIKKKDAEIREYYVLRYKPTKGTENPWRLTKKLSFAKGDDDADVIGVLVDHGMLLAAISEKSALVTEKSALSVDKLYKSSKRLEYLTDILIGLTLFLTALAVMELFPEFYTTPLKVFFVIFVFVVVMFGFIYRKTNA